ncbi:MAG: GH1 family beta-glucosidase [Gammaproteobacteria bacterium]|nr:GH1 family beta-glucosidase [Gammaproteobacteria bacterium]
MPFPQDFAWGAATSSYQVEGAAWRAGGGPSVWDMFDRQPGRVANGDTGENACDHVARYRDDVALMAQIGLGAYRFSISWPRVLPEGVGRINERGLDFYDSLVDALLERGIEPWVTLFHWDFPYELYCRGGWLNRDSADWFADYTSLVVERLSDRVTRWCTLNEPQIYIGLGHLDGSHAPGLQMGMREALLAGHHTLLAHGKSVQAIRAHALAAPSVSAVQACFVYVPERDHELDIETARRASFAVRERHFFNNSWLCEPMLRGCYPADGLELFADDLPALRSGDLETICQPLDFLACNIYWGSYLRARDEDRFDLVERDDMTRSAMGWPVTPEVMYWAPKFFAERYDLPVVVTENGFAAEDVVRDGRVDDAARIDFHRRYLNEYARAIEDGVDCRGYFAWSLLDNFEWAEGYAKRFGMVHVDYASQRRTPKDSAYWYSHVIAANAVVDDNPRGFADKGASIRAVDAAAKGRA